MEHTLSSSRRLVTELKKLSNQAQLDVYSHLYALEDSEVWKNREYYEGELGLIEYADGTFFTFLKGIFGVSRLWYQSLKSIVDLPDGASLCAVYGRSNMATFLNSTIEERAAILEAARISKVSPNFYYLKRKLFPDSFSKNVNSVWKEKFNQLKAEFEEYKVQAEQNIEALKAALKLIATEDSYQKQSAING